MIKLQTTNNQFEALAKASNKRGKQVTIEKLALQRLVRDHSHVLSILRTHGETWDTRDG